MPKSHPFSRWPDNLPPLETAEKLRAERDELARVLEVEHRALADLATKHGLYACDKRTGRLINAIITLPGKSKRLADVAKHEFGHALGLDHGPEGTLMAAHLPTPGYPAPLADYQLRALRK